MWAAGIVCEYFKVLYGKSVDKPTLSTILTDTSYKYQLSIKRQTKKVSESVLRHFGHLFVNELPTARMKRRIYVHV